MVWGGHTNQPRGEKIGNAKLTEVQVLEMRQLYAEGKVTQMELAAKYGVGGATVNSVLNRKTWKHVGPFRDDPASPAQWIKDRLDDLETGVKVTIEDE